MNLSYHKIMFLLFLLVFLACNENTKQGKQGILTDSTRKGSYGYDMDFLKKHTQKSIELQDETGQAKILLSADYQGRVMTSTATGDTGTSYGWLNYDLIGSGIKKKQFNPVGGEERFWMGPEGGQYSVYFEKGDSFNIAHWQVPGIIDTAMFDIAENDHSKAVFTKKAVLTNYSGTTFDISIQRTIYLLDKKTIEQKLSISLPDNVHSVGYETDNQLKNVGSKDWKKENGLLSIWLLGMMKPGDKTFVIIPFKPISNASSYITNNYFGDIPPERLQVKDSILYFTCDGKKRSKIGLSPLIAKPVAASFDFEKNVLTLIIFSVDQNALYVNSKWEIQAQPYKGDVVNSYNDGPLTDGSQLGPFYEIESSSPASELKKEAIQQYRQTTFHLQGDYDALQLLAKKILGMDLNDLKK